MNKNEFLAALEERLRSMPQAEREMTLSYYAEMIDDRMENGMTEQEAVAAMGDPDEVARQAIETLPIGKQIWTKATAKGASTKLLGALALLTAFIWVPVAFSLLIAFAAVYFSIWVTILALYALPVGLVCGLVGAGALMVVSFSTGLLTAGLGYLSAALTLAGLAILSFLLLSKMSSILLRGSKRFFRWGRSLIVYRLDKKEETK